MDPIRSDLLAAAHNLSILAIRLADVESDLNPHDRTGGIGMLQPPSAWLDCRENLAVTGAERFVRAAIEACLELIRSPGPIDPRHAAYVLHISVGDAVAFSSRVRAFAKKHGVDLASHPRDELGCYAVGDRARRREDWFTGRSPKPD